MWSMVYSDIRACGFDSDNMTMVLAFYFETSSPLMLPTSFLMLIQFSENDRGAL